MNNTTNPVFTEQKCAFLFPITWDHNLADATAAKATSIAGIAINTFTAPLVVIANMFLFLQIMVKDRSLLEEERILAVLFLTIADIFSGLVTQPLFIAKELYHLITRQVNCILDTACYISAMIFCAASFHHFAIIAYDRYVAIIKPYRYVNVITIRKLTISSISAWLCCIAFTVIYIFFTSEAMRYFLDFLYFVESSVITAFILFSYIKIFLAIRSQRRSVAAVEMQIDGQENEERNRRDAHSVITSGILFCLFLIGVTPVVAISVVFVIHGGEARTDLFFICLPLLETFVLMGSLLNPLTIIARTTELKRGFRKLLRFNKQEEDRNAPPSHH